MKFAPILFFAFSIYDYTLATNSTTFSYQPLAAECLILLIYIIYFFYEKIQISTSIPIYQTNIFWIIVAFTIYSSGNFFLFLYSNNAIKNQEFFFQFTLIYSTFTILKNIFLCVGLAIKQPIEDSSPSIINFKDFPDNDDFLTKSQI